MIYSTEAEEAHMPNTTAEQSIAAAQARYQTDWDAEGTTTLSFPRDVADALLAARGWTLKGDGRWVAPNGVASCWHTDEALRLALTSEVI